MSTKTILKHILDENLIDAQREIHSLLTVKVGDALQQFKEDYIPFVYSESLGSAGIAEAKKKAKVTDKEDDGEGMDPVGHGDSDVDNDGDSDESDEYLKNRRKAIGKAIDKEDDDEDEDDVKESDNPVDRIQGNPYGSLRPKGIGSRKKNEDVKEGYNVTAKHDDHIKASTAIGSGTQGRKGPLAGGKSLGDGKYDLRFDNEKTGKKFMQKHGFKEEVEISERGDARATHIYGVERTKYSAMTDQQKDQVKAKYYREAETANRERR